MNKFLTSIILIFLIGCSKEDVYEPLPTPTPIPIENKLIDNFNIDYSKPSYFTSIPLPEVDYNYREFSNWGPPLDAVMLDFDNDGILDIVDSNSDYGTTNVNKLLFLKGNKDNTFSTNYSPGSFNGLVNGRKGIVNDFNSDSYPDMFFAGTGLDFEPWPGEHNVLLMNNGDGTFTETRYESNIGYFHSTASGDLDNDGDLDILALAPRVDNSYILYNSGGSFDLVPLRQETYDSYDNNNILFYNYIGGNDDKYKFQMKFSTEIVDYDNDGYDDIFLAGHEQDYLGGDLTPSVIIKGSSEGYHDIIELPSLSPWSVITDIDFYDMNGDNIMEIFLTRTQIDPFYESTFIQVIDGATLTDVTFNYFDYGVNEARSYVDNPQRGWIYWMTIYNKDGEIYFTSNDFSNNIKWKYSGGKFIKIAS
jgi:hypothetical protein